MQDNLAAGARVDSRRGFRRRDRQPTCDADQSGREEQGEQGDEHYPDHDARGGLTETRKFTVGGKHGTRLSHARLTHALSVAAAAAALAAAVMTASSSLVNSGWAVLWMECAAPSNLRTSLGLAVTVRVRGRGRGRGRVRVRVRIRARVRLGQG